MVTTQRPGQNREGEERTLISALTTSNRASPSLRTKLNEVLNERFNERLNEKFNETFNDKGSLTGKFVLLKPEEREVTVEL